MGNFKSRQRTSLLVLTDSSETLPEDVEALVHFISTTSGSKWLASILMEWPGHMHKLQKATLGELNHFIIGKYKDFVASDLGRRMIHVPGQRTAAAQDTLILPIYIVEDFIRQRLSSKITRNWWSIGFFLATRTPFMCAVVHYSKHLLKKHVLERHKQGRARKLVSAAEFVLDELLPTGFYGPLLTYGLLAHKMVHELKDN